METRKKKSFKRLFAFLMAFVMVTTLAVSAVFAAPTFSDVPETHEFYEDIEFLYSKDIVGGYGSTGKYGPEDLLTRAQAAKMIALAAEKEVSEDFETEFTDVPATLDLHEHIWALEEAEVVKGFGDTNEFRPARNITRGHVAVMLQRALKLKKGAVPVLFTDLPKDDPEVKAAIEVLASNGVVKGYGSTGLFKPNEPVTRGQFAKMVAGAMDATKTVIESVNAVEQTIAKGVATKLKFEVNGRLEDADTFIAKYGVAALGVTKGYTVTFLFDTTSGVNANGTVNVGTAGSFKYAVQITDANGDDMPETVAHTDYEKVTVVDEEVAVKILEYGLYLVDDEDEEVDFIVLSENGDTYTILATKALNGLGEEIDINEYPSEAKSSKITVAKWLGAPNNEVDATAVGKTTFTLKFGDIKETYPLVVEVKAARVVTALTNKDVRIAAAGSDDIANADEDSSEYYLNLEYIDQYGDEFTDDSVLDDVDVKVQELFGDRRIVDPVEGEDYYDLSAKGDYHVTARLGTKLLGTFKISSIEVKEADEIKYTLEFDDEDVTELDINPLDEVDTLDINVLASRNGVAWVVPSANLGAKSSDDEIADVTYALAVITVEDAEKVGSITVTFYEQSGSMQTPKATIVVKVVNSAPQITDLKMKAGVEKVRINAGGSVTFINAVEDLESAILDAYLKANEISGKSVEDILSSATVVYSAADGKISVTLDKVFGGAVFEFPVVNQPL